VATISAPQRVSLKRISSPAASGKVGRQEGSRTSESASPFERYVKRPILVMAEEHGEQGPGKPAAALIAPQKLVAARDTCHPPVTIPPFTISTPLDEFLGSTPHSAAVEVSARPGFRLSARTRSATSSVSSARIRFLSCLLLTNPFLTRSPSDL